MLSYNIFLHILLSHHTNTVILFVSHLMLHDLSVDTVFSKGAVSTPVVCVALFLTPATLVAEARIWPNLELCLPFLA